MIDPSDVSGSVSTYDGVVSLPVVLGAISAPGITDVLSLTYSSDVQRDATLWNLDAPTGVAGLGWSLGLSFIARLPSRSVAESRERIVMTVRGQSSPLVRTGTATDGAVLYAPTVFQPWTIRFYENEERWVVNTEDGETLILGDHNSGRHTVGRRVVWDNWFGASGQTAGQSHVASVWFLSERRNQFGQGFDYTYSLVDVPVGDEDGAAYMQAAYLTRIVATTGAALQLGYVEKDPVEYTDPHTQPPPPNAYQSAFQTRCLQTVATVSRTGNTVSTVELLYDDGNGDTAFLGTGALSKRLLTGLRQSFASGAASPDTRFVYWGQSSDDKVSADTPYSDETKGLYGALKSLQLAEGGLARFDYAALEPHYSDRQLPVTPPSATDTSPRVVMEDGYCAVTWLASGETGFAVQAYTWDGRWIPASLGTLPCADADSYRALPLAASRTVLAAFAAPQLHLWRGAEGRPGAWIAPDVENGGSSADYYSPELNDGEPTTLKAGADFAGLLGHTSGKLFLYRFNGQGWSANTPLTIGADPQLLAMSAEDSVLLVASLAEGAGNAPVVIDLFVNAGGAIGRHTLQFANRQTRSDAISLVQGTGFATVRVDSHVGGRTVSDYAVIQWDQDFSDLTASWFDGLEASRTPEIHGSTIAIGRTLLTYDGRRWTAFDTDTVAYPDQVSVEAFEPGDSVCVRKIKTSGNGGEAYVYDLLDFDPNTGEWAVPDGMKIDTASGEGALAPPRDSDTAGRYAVLDNTVYYRRPDASWEASGTVAPGSAADADSLVLETLFAAYQTGSGTASVESHVVPLENGSAGPADTVSGAGFSVSGQAPGYLVGRNAVLTYSGDFSGTPDNVALNRLERGQVQGRQTVYAAARLSMDTGYRRDVLSQSYAIDHAVARMGGWTGAYQKVTSLTGADTVADAAMGPTVELFFNGLTPDEADGLEYPAGAGSNAATYYGYVRGLSYKALSYAKSSPEADPVAEATSWWVVTVAGIGNAAQSAYSRQAQGMTARDGATRTTTYQYGDYGLTASIQTERYDSANHRIVSTQSFTRWPEIYDPDGEMAAPLAAPVVKTVIANQDETAGDDAVIESVQITTWSDQWSGHASAWAPCKTFSALNATPGGFDHWHDTDPFTPDGDGWRQTSVVLARTQTGLPEETADVLRVRTSRIHDQAGQLVTAVGQNASIGAGEFSSFGFEAYETPGPWRWGPSGTIGAHITGQDRNTGERCLAIPYSSDGATGPFAAFYPLQQSGAYVFACWAQLSAGAGSGAAKWTIQAYKQDDHSAVGDPLTLDMTGTGTRWTLCQICIDLSKIRQGAGIGEAVPLYLGISAGNSLESVTCLVDDLRFAPLESRVEAGVYDPDTLLETGALDANSQVRRTLHDSCDRPFAQIGAGERVEEARLESFSRQLTGEDAFQPVFGNTTVRISSLTSSYYDDFFSSRTDRWSFAPAADWAVDRGRLNYSGGAGTGLGGTATYIAQAHTNMGASVEIASRDAAADIAIGNGDLFVRWNAAEARWELVRLSGDTVTVEAVNTAVGLQRRVSIVIVDGFAMAFSEGTQIFAFEYNYPDPVPADYGKCVIAATGHAAFDNLVVFDDPSLSTVTSDGTGRSLQQLDLIGYKARGVSAGDYPAQSQGVLLDGAGRPAYVRNTSQGPLEIAPVEAGGAGEDESDSASLLIASPDANLYSEEGDPLSVAQYLDGYEGFYDYLDQGFEDSALSRPTNFLLPRSTEAEAGNHEISLAYTSAAGLPGASVPANQPAHYYVTSASRLFAIDASDNRVSVTQTEYTDFDGRPLFRQSEASDGSVSRKQALIYDTAGRLITMKQPNAFDPPGGSAAETWQQSWQYTFQGEVSQATDPDTGTTQYLYDRAGRLRFMMGASGAAMTPQQIVYRKYDALSRVVETGTIQDPDYDFSALAGKVDDGAFPQVVASDPAGPLQAVGAWTYQYAYDRDTDDGIANLIGRVHSVAINNGDAATPDSETYSYDIHGNATRQVTAAESYSPGAAFTLDYTYNNRDLVETITYPEALTGAQSAFAAGYFYDRLGRLSSIGLPVPEGGVIDPANPPTPPERAFALYGYDMEGRLSDLQLNNQANLDDPQPPIQRQFDYDDCGRLTLVADRYSSDHFHYDTEGGVGGVRYFNGLIASVQRETQAGEFWPCRPDNDQTIAFAYDGLGQLTEAESDLGWPYRLAMGDDAYDANGNMLSQTRGVAQRAFVFKEADGKRVNNQVASVDSQVADAASIDFETAPADATVLGPWSWGANNGGSSGSHISTDSPHSGTQCLYLAGGGGNHRESLRLDAYLDPRGSYTLNGYVRTQDGFAAAGGQAYWHIQVSGPGEILLDKQLAVIADTSEWTAFGPLSLDLSGILSTLGASGDTVTVSVILVNAKQGTDGTTGPGLYVDDIVLSGTVSGAGYDYDAAGRVSSAPARGLHRLAYEPVVNRTNLIQLGDASGDKYLYGFDSGGERLVGRRTNADGSDVVSAEVSLCGLGTTPLFEKSRTGEQEERRFRIPGLNGLVAYSDGGEWTYVLGDWLGSTELIFDSGSAVSASADYLPFGPLSITSGEPTTRTLYGGQALDADTGLYDFHARLYDPELGRFYAADPAGQYASPYVYAGNDPVNRIDPDGRYAVLATATVVGLTTVYMMGLRRTLKWGAVGAALSPVGAYLGAQFGATRYWDDFGFHSLFTRIFDKDTVDYLQKGEFGFPLSLPGVRSAAVTLGRVLFNFSREEYRAISNVYPWTGPFMTPMVLLKVYRAVQEDIQHNWGPDGWGNAARHFFWMGRAERFGGRALSNAIADAHEEGRPGRGALGFYDNIADKINNVLGQYHAAGSDEDLQAIYNRLKTLNGGVLALSGEGSALFRDVEPQSMKEGIRSAVVHASFARALAHIESEFQVQPHFDSEERDYLCKAIGWKCPP